MTTSATGEFYYDVTENAVHGTTFTRHPHCLAVDDAKLTRKFQRVTFRLTHVHGSIVTKVQLDNRFATRASHRWAWHTYLKIRAADVGDG